MANIFGEAGEKRALYLALTRYNYFPNQRANIGELPPSIDTRQFTPEVAEALASLEESRERRGSGYDLIEYKATRYNNVPRILGIIHPKAYALLAKCIHDNWDQLRSVTRNKNSIIKPEFHHEEKRLIVMNYEDPTEKITRSHKVSFAKRFRVYADIANCFNSIYSHAIPWAAVGMSEAKAKKNDRQAWFNQLDMFQRKTKRNETQGIPIGPVTSSISVELILNKVDVALIERGYEFYRYVDDYTCYCETDDEAQQFLTDLGNLLSKYKLSLNLRKTKIDTLPAPQEDSWVLELRGVLPSRLSFASDTEPKLNTSEALTFINRAILINKSTPDGSVLKYAVSLVISHLDDSAPFNLLDPLLNLSWHYPVLLPLVDSLLKQAELNADICKHQLNEIINENAEKNRSDGMAWPLHTMLKHGLVAEQITVEKVIESKDCVAMTLLLEMEGCTEKVASFANEFIQNSDNYDKDTYWLLFYQLFRKGLIADPYLDGVFDCLKAFDVNFIPSEDISETEVKCDDISRRIDSEDMAKIFSSIFEGVPEKITEPESI